MFAELILSSAKQAMTLLERLQRLPPVVVRLCARTNGRLASGTEIAARSGLSVDWIAMISPRRSWPDRTGIATISKFYAACGVDPFRPVPTLAFIKRGLLSSNGFAHINALKKAPRQYRLLYPYAMSLISGVREWRTKRVQTPTETMPHV